MAAHQAPHPWDSPGKNTRVGCHFLLQCMKVKSESEVAQSCLTPSDPMDCSLPGSSIHGIFQARVLEWIAIGNTTMIKTDMVLITTELKGWWKDKTSMWLQNSMIRDFLIMVKESTFQCRGHRFNPWWGNQDRTTTEPARPQLESPSATKYRPHTLWTLQATTREKFTCHSERAHLPQRRLNAANKKK